MVMLKRGMKLTDCQAEMESSMFACHTIKSKINVKMDIDLKI